MVGIKQRMPAPAVNMTPQTKSSQGRHCYGYGLYDEYQYEQGMSPSLKCLYSVSPPIHPMAKGYASLPKDQQTEGHSILFKEQGHPKCTEISMPYVDSCYKKGKLNHKEENRRCDDVKSCLKSTSLNTKVKSVTFADTHGLALTAIKYMTESTKEPPELQALSGIFRSVAISTAPEYRGFSGSIKKPFLVAEFTQPAGDYIGFKNKLEKNNVSLENVILKEMTSISGTVKVRNVSFEKRVFVRISFDGWRSFQDHGASYVKSSSGYESQYGYDVYDTFQFTIPIPISFDSLMQKGEFCVCYRADGSEFWDNNYGANYVVKANVFSRHQLGASDECDSFPIPNTYCELPSPQFNTWLDWENKGPFY